VHPTPLASFGDLWERTAVGPVPGQVVLAVGAFFYLSLLAIGVITFRPLNRVKRDLSATPAQDRLRILAGTEQY
jgi:uncharacterized membrane protein